MEVNKMEKENTITSIILQGANQPNNNVNVNFNLSDMVYDQPNSNEVPNDLILSDFISKSTTVSVEHEFYAQHPSLFKRFTSDLFDIKTKYELKTDEKVVLDKLMENCQTVVNGFCNDQIDIVIVDSKIKSFFDEIFSPPENVEFSVNYDINILYCYLLKRLEIIETNGDECFVKRFSKASSGNDSNTFFKVRSCVECLHTGLKNILHSGKQDYIIRFPCSYSTELLHFNSNNVIVPYHTNSHRLGGTSRRLLCFLYLFLLFYDALLLLCDDDDIDQKNLRQIYYLLKALISYEGELDNLYFIRQVAVVFELIEINPYSKIFAQIERRVNAEINGDLTIIVKDDNHTIKFDFSQHISHLYMFDLNTHQIIIGKNVKYLFVFESKAALSEHVKNKTLNNMIKEKTVIALHMSGSPQLFTRLFLNKFSRECPNVPVICNFDCDVGGYSFFHLIKYGGLSYYTYLNEYLTVPHAIHFGIHSYQLKSNNSGKTFWSNMDEITRARFNKSLKRYRVFFPNNVEHINNLIDIVTSTKICSSATIDKDQNIDDMMNFLNGFSVESLCYQAKDGMLYLQHLDEKAFYDANERFNIQAITYTELFIKHGIGHQFVNKFCSIVNKKFNDKYFMHSIAFNVIEVKSEQYKYQKKTDDIQIGQINNGQYYLVHFSHETNNLNVYLFGFEEIPDKDPKKKAEHLKKLQAQMIITKRYANAIIVYNYISKQSHIHLSALVCCMWVTDIIIKKIPNTKRKQISPEKAFEWLSDSIVKEQFNCF